MITTRIIGGDNKEVHVGPEGEVGVVVHSHPALNEALVSLPFRSYFKNSSDSEDMTVDGSSTPQDFYIEASPDYEIYIKYISIIIGDGGSPALNKFGALTALSNGIKWIWATQSEGEYELHDGIKTNIEFIRIGGDTAAIGTGTDAFLADVSGGGTEKSYLPNIDMSETFGMPWGLKLVKGSTDKLIFRVPDDVTGLTTFNIIGYGIRI